MCPPAEVAIAGARPPESICLKPYIPNAHAKRQKPLAVFELVKNADNADAEKVTSEIVIGVEGLEGTDNPSLREACCSWSLR